jgi:hypothetical protein
MPTIVPSQVCSFIDTEFRYIPRENTPQSQILPLSSTVCGSLRALISLVERLPGALLPAEASDYGDFISSLETIRHTVALAERQDASDIAKRGEIKLLPGVRAGGWNPVLVIRQVLERCPDDTAPTSSKDLLFIKDPSLRAELLTDLTSARSALLNSEWKPATVIAGSLAEALLLWAIDQKATEVPNACAALNARGKLRKLSPGDVESWVLEQYIGVANELRLIDPDTLSQLHLVREFRNLIHPGRARRKSQRCDRGTALSANAGVELLARDLETRFP